MRIQLGIAAVFAVLLSLVVGLRIPTSAALAEEQPTIAKASVQVNAFTHNVYKKNDDVWSWTPRIDFRVNGPIPEGGQLYVEFSMPGMGPWVKFDCPTEATAKDRWWRTSGGGRDVPEEKATLYTGPVNFAIKPRNELAGTDTTLFTGQARVEKTRSNEQGPKAANKFVYFANHDWNLPHRLRLPDSRQPEGLGASGAQHRLLGPRRRGEVRPPPLLPGEGDREEVHRRNRGWEAKW